MTLLAAFLGVLFLYGLVSARLERTVVTGPMVFTAAGMATALSLPASPDVESGRHVFLTVAEVGLVLLLFADASRTDLGLLRSIRSLPLRLLSVGMLLTIGVGALAAIAVFPTLSIWEAGILAAILAPTDAGLGQVIVKSNAVPAKIREALNVEAGLNDGLSVPFLLFFIALAAAGTGETEARLGAFFVEQLGYGVAVGGAIGGIGGWLLGLSQRSGWLAPSLRGIAVVVLPLLAILASDAVGASMFIAAFVAGMVAQRGFPEVSGHSVEFTEEWGQILNDAVFFLFGLIVAASWGRLSPRAFLYAVLSLTVVRMLPVAIALLRTGLGTKTFLFMGWFGPRGLASIVLGLVYLEHQVGGAAAPAIHTATAATVLVSIFAHGLTAKPGIGFLGHSSGTGVQVSSGS